MSTTTRLPHGNVAPILTALALSPAPIKMTTPLPRLLSLLKTQCSIFNTTFNPTRQRMGNKILRQRLRGPAMAAYYPRRIATIKDLAKAYPDYEVIDEDEDDRLENVQITKSRGKGPPKKKRTKEVQVGKKRKK